MSTPTRTRYQPTPTDVHRLLLAFTLTSITVWSVWAVPVAEWALSSAESASSEIGRAAAAQDVIAQGWWAVIAITLALALGSLLSVAVDYSQGGNWTAAALKNAVRLASTVAAMWAIWTTGTLAAAGVQVTG